MGSLYRSQHELVLVFKNGQVAEQMVGAKSKRDLKASLDRALALAPA